MEPPLLPRVPSPEELHELLRGILALGLTARFRTTGASMTPFVRDGDVVRVRPFGPGEPAVGDVVALWHRSRCHVLVHRVVARRREGLLTRGDGAPSSDGVVPLPEILGIVGGVERDGRPVEAGLGRWGPAIALATRIGLWRLLGAVTRRLWPRGGG